MAMKINKLEIENVKRVKAVKMEPSANGLTIIGGNNAEGKTSVLDAIAWALGGNSYRPSEPMRRGSATAPYLKVVMNNGLVVERKGKNSSLTVTDPSGQKAGQQLLDSFVEKLALDLPRFMQANDKEKAQTLLNIIGVGPQLAVIEAAEKQKYQERVMVGRVADQKQKFAKEMPYFPNAPKDVLSVSDLIRQQQDILLRNARRQEIRAKATEMEKRADLAEAALSQAYSAAAEAERRLEEAKAAYNKACEEKDLAFADADTAGDDEPIDELKANIDQIEEINRQVRANLDKDKAEDDAREYVLEYENLSKEIDSLRKEKADLLNAADLPLPDLAVSDGRLIYKGQAWDNMSGAEQLIVSTAIVRRLNPECGFVLMDKLEQMDQTTLREFGAWLEKEGLQVIATRVSTGSECQIIIEDGYGEMAAPKAAPKATWKKGEF